MGEGAWHLRNIRLLKNPVSVKGQLGIYEIDVSQ